MNKYIILIISAFCNTTIAQTTIQWETYLGGDGNDGLDGITTLNDGSHILFGASDSQSGLSTIGAYQLTNAGGFDGVIAKYQSNGEKSWCTFLGGSEYDYVSDLCVLADGRLAFCGVTFSQDGLSYGDSSQSFCAGESDGFFGIIDSNGQMQYLTYFGGPLQDGFNAICTNSSNEIFITGTFESPELATENSYQPIHGGSTDAFICCFDNTELIWSTYLGGSGADGSALISCQNNDVFIIGESTSSTGLATENAADPTINGTESSFIGKMQNTGQIDWVSFWSNGNEDARCLLLDNSGNIYLGGVANDGSDMATIGAFDETQEGVFDGFIAKVANDGFLQWFTYYGADPTFPERILNGKIDSNGTLIFGGVTRAMSGIATSGAFQETPPDSGSNTEGFLVSFNNSGERLWGTYIGAIGGAELVSDLTISDGSLVLVLSCSETSNWLPTAGLQTNYGGGAYDNYVLRLDHILSHHEINGNNFNLFPNPSNSFSEIKIQLNADIIQFDIYDACGRWVYGDTNSSKSEYMILKAGDLKSGCHILKMFDSSGQVYDCKLIIE